MALRAICFLITLGALLLNSASAQESTNLISISSAAFNINEASTNLTIHLIRSGDTNATTSVEFQIELLTATTDDLTPHSATVTFAPGQTNQPVLIEILDDTIREQPETFRLALSNPAADFTLATPHTADATIHDNDHPAGIDETFHLSGFYSLPPRIASVQKILPLQDGLIFVGGESSALVVDQDGTPQSQGVLARVTDAVGTPEGLIHYMSRDRGLMRMSIAGISDDSLKVALYSQQRPPTLALLDTGDILIGGWLGKGPGETNALAVAKITKFGELDLDFRTNDFRGMAATALLVSGDRFYAALISTNDQGETKYTLGRCHSDGTRDSDYPLLPFGGEIGELCFTPEGKLLVAGKFESAAGTNHKFLVRLNSDGSLDSAFVPEIDGPILAIAFQIDGGILIGGDFSVVNGFPRNCFARLLPSGALDTTFDHGRGPNAPVHTIAVQPDGAILLGGDFSEFSGHPSQLAVRLKGESVGNGKFVYLARSLFAAHESTGVGTLEIYRAGGLNQSLPVSFQLIPGTAEENLDFSLPTLQTTFEPGESHKLVPFTILSDPFPEGREHFQVVLETTNPEVLVSRPRATIRVQDRQTSGTYDAATQFPVTGGGPVALQEDGMILTGLSHLVRLSPDGAVDPAFNTNDFALPPGPGKIQGILPMPGGKIYVLGSFWYTNQSTRLNLSARLHSNGTIDSEFVSPVGGGPYYHDLYAYSANADGVWALDERGITHFQHNGRPVYIRSYHAWDFTITDDGALYFATNDGVSAFESAEHFAPWLTGHVSTICFQDGRFWVGGTMWNNLTSERLYLARLNFDGSLDESFQANLNGSVQRIQTLANNEILIVGDFTKVDGVPRRHLAILHSNGEPDLDFDPGFGPSGLPASILELSDGSLLLSGPELTRYDGEPVPGLIRIFRDVQNSPGSTTITLKKSLEGQWLITAPATPGLTCTLESSADLNTWSPVTEQTATSDTLQFSIQPSNELHLFYRLRLQP